jgi:transposase
VADRNSPQKHVWWARIILAAIGGCGTSEIMRRIGKNKPCVWRWQARFMAKGLAALLRDKTRLPPLPKASVEQAIKLTCAPAPREVTHRTGRATAKAAGISLSAVQGIWKAHGPVPCRVRTFKLCPRTWSSSA